MLVVLQEVSNENRQDEHARGQGAGHVDRDRDVRDDGRQLDPNQRHHLQQVAASRCSPAAASGTTSVPVTSSGSH